MPPWPQSSAEEPPLASIIIPVFNGLPHLSDQLSALLSQRCGFSWEALYVDNGSRDGSAEEILRVIEDKGLKQVRLVDGSQRPGQVHARNVGSAEARGKILVFTDQDDLPAEDWLEQLVRAIDDADAVGGFVEVTDHGTAPAPGKKPATDSLPVFLGRYPVALGTNFAIRKAVLDAIGGWKDVGVFAGEDVDICVRLHLAGFSLKYVPTARLTWRSRLETKNIFRQGFTYGRADVLLFKRYCSRGAERPTLRTSLRSWRNLLRELYRYLRGGSPNLGVIHQLGWSLGRVRESIASRTLFL